MKPLNNRLREWLEITGRRTDSAKAAAASLHISEGVSIKEAAQAHGIHATNPYWLLKRYGSEMDRIEAKCKEAGITTGQLAELIAVVKEAKEAKQ